MTITNYRNVPAIQLSFLERFAQAINTRFKYNSPTSIVTKTVALLALAHLAALYLRRNCPRPLHRDPIAILKYLIRFIPKLNQKVTEEYRKFRNNLEIKIFKGINPDEILTRLPEQGLTSKAILKRYQDIAGTTHNGKNTGAVYCFDPKVTDLGRAAAQLGELTNPIHLNLAPKIRQMEAEACSMVAKMFNGDDHACGNITSGGTESIHHAVYAARERARSMGITSDWEMILPTTAHPAFRKSAHQLCIKVINASVHPENHLRAGQVNIDAIEKQISNRTILVVGSLPNFPHGTIDPIEEISNLLEKKDPSGYIGLHVDGCLGGFVIPFMHKAGFTDGPNKFGFDISRVTSVSADTHKYGGDEKGSSTIIFRDISWKRHLVFVDQAWPGGIYATPTLPGSRPGSVILRVHAVLSYMGVNGYVEQTKKTIALTRKLIKKIGRNPHLKILGNPNSMLFAFTFRNSQHNIHDLNDEMTKKGWYLSGLQKPNGIHLCVTPVHANNQNFASEFMHDIEESIEAVLALRPDQRGKSSDARTYGSNERMDESIFVGDFAVEYWNIASQTHPTSFDLVNSASSQSGSSSSSEEM